VVVKAVLAFKGGKLKKRNRRFESKAKENCPPTRSALVGKAFPLENDKPAIPERKGKGAGRGQSEKRVLPIIERRKREREDAQNLQKKKNRLPWRSKI